MPLRSDAGAVQRNTPLTFGQVPDANGPVPFSPLPSFAAGVMLWCSALLTGTCNQYSAFATAYKFLASRGNDSSARSKRNPGCVKSRGVSGALAVRTFRCHTSATAFVLSSFFFFSAQRAFLRNPF